MLERQFQLTSGQCAAHGELIVKRSAKTVQEHWLILVGVEQF